MLAALRSSAPRTLTRFLTQARVFSFSQISSAKISTDSQKKPEANYPLDNLFIELSSTLGTEAGIATNSISAITSKYKKINMANFERIPFEDLLLLLKDFASMPEVIQESSVKVSDIIFSLKEYLLEINSKNVAIIVWALSKLESFDETLYNRTQDIIIQNISSFEPNDISMIAWGFAKSHLGTKDFWSHTTNQIKEVMPKMSPLDLTQIVWALSKIRHDDPIMWRDLETNIEKCLTNIENGQAVSLFMMSFAKMGKGTDKFWRKLESKFAELIPLFEGHSLSNGLWALAKRNKLVIIKGKDLENLLLQKLEKLKDIEVASVSCSLIRLSIGSPSFWTVVSRIISKDLKNSPHNIDIVTLCSYAWVFKNIKEINPKDWDLLEKQILIKKEDIRPNHLYTIVAGFAAKKQGSNDFWREIERKTTQLIDEFDVANLTQIMWGFATRAKGSLELWRLFSQHLANQIDHACLCDKIVGLWGLAKSRKDIDPLVLEPIVESISNQYDELKPVDIGMFMWSLGKLKFINDTTREVVKKVQEKIKSHEEMSMIDLAQIISAINELNLGDTEFWSIIEAMIKERAVEIQEEGWGILIKAACENAEFSEDFWEFSEKTLFKNINRFSGDTIVSFMRGFYKKEIKDPQLWTMMEEEVKKKLETLEEGALTECAAILSKRRINQNEFWFKLESVILGQLDGMRTGVLARLTHSFGASEQGSLDLWKKIQEKLKVKFQEERFIHQSALIQILIGFSKRRKGDHQFWNMLENRILENLKSDQLREKELWSIILEFSKVKRGSRKLWMKVIEILMANLDKMTFRSLLVAITRLDLVKEIDETEKTMLNNKLLERILVSSSDFGQLLKQLSQFEGICKRLTKTEIERITEKVTLQSRKIADTSAAEQMQVFLQKIQKHAETPSTWSSQS